MEEDRSASITFVDDDPFAWIIPLCQPTASQEAKLANCPMARQFEFADSASSPDPLPSEPTEIVVTSPPPASPVSEEDGSEEECQ